MHALGRGSRGGRTGRQARRLTGTNARRPSFFFVALPENAAPPRRACTATPPRACPHSRLPRASTQWCGDEGQASVLNGPPRAGPGVPPSPLRSSGAHSARPHRHAQPPHRPPSHEPGGCVLGGQSARAGVAAAGRVGVRRARTPHPPPLRGGLPHSSPSLSLSRTWVTRPDAAAAAAGAASAANERVEARARDARAAGAGAEADAMALDATAPDRAARARPASRARREARRMVKECVKCVCVCRGRGTPGAQQAARIRELCFLSPLTSLHNDSLSTPPQVSCAGRSVFYTRSTAHTHAVTQKQRKIKAIEKTRPFY